MTPQEIGAEIRTQGDNQPIFIVQSKVKMRGMMKDYAEGYTWVDEDDYEADAATAKRLDKQYEPEGWEKMYYETYWVHITTCFTEAGCKDFISKYGHRYGELRIHPKGGFPNAEWETVREHLMGLT